MRLWPLSRTRAPKQIAPITATPLEAVSTPSLLARTLRRTLEAGCLPSPIVITIEILLEPIRDALHMLDHPEQAFLLVEPMARNTAIAACVAALWAQRAKIDLVALFPADHDIKRVSQFRTALARAARAARQDRIVMLGERARRPETGFGYIEQGPRLFPGCHLVSSFEEKPTEERAARLTLDDRYLWNCGIFVARPEILLDEARTLAPEIMDAAKHALTRARSQDHGRIVRLARKPYARIAPIAFDRAIVEHSARTAVVPVAMGWRDLGSWQALWESSSKDAHANVVRGKVLAHSSRNCYLRSDGALVAAVGVSDLAIVASRDAILVAPLHAQKEIEQTAEMLARKKNRVAADPVQERRPWGSFEIIERGVGFCIKRLIVTPGGRLSLQRHRYRSEHWVVLRGVATITLDGKQIQAPANQSLFIAQGAVHRLCNNQKEILEIIEVQVGGYLGEDDIERLADDYDRL